jgi:hypothetical protein
VAQKCFYHPRVDATTQCESCKLSICDQCELEDLCRDCRNKRRAIADRQRRAAQAREEGEEPPPLEAPPEAAKQPWTYDPERVSYRRPELAQPVVHKRSRPKLGEWLAALDPRLWGVVAAVAVLGLGAWLGWWGGEAEAPPPELSLATPAATPAATATPAPAARTPDPAKRAVWEEAERLAQQHVAGGQQAPSPGASASAPPRAGAAPAPPRRPAPGGDPVVTKARPARPMPRRSVAPGQAAAARAGLSSPSRLAGRLRPQAMTPRQVQPAGSRPATRARLAAARQQARARRVAGLKARRLRPAVQRPPRVEPAGAPLVTRWDD